MFNGQMKAITFSYDDGITQDRRLIKILNKYGLKSTFNLNSGLLGTSASLSGTGITVPHVKPNANEVADIYRGHEVAVHTLTHPLLTTLPDKEVIRQVEEDKKHLSEIVGYEVIGMAYPCGGENHDDRVAKLIAENTSVTYARTILSTHSFDLPTNLFKWNPTVYHLDMDKMFELGEEFLALCADTPRLFYIWGHSYEFDYEDTWDKFEQFCEMIAGRDDIFYGTNAEIVSAFLG